MRRIRVLVVDDAVAVRRLVSDVLSGDPSIEVAGTAASGRIALAKIANDRPDIVILDIEMPEMDGLETLSAIRRSHPDLPVIMFSTLTRRGAEATLTALSLGATDYVTKPSSEGGSTTALQVVKDELVERIKAFCPGIHAVEDAPAGAAAHPDAPSHPGTRQEVEALVIGVSTGGPNALAALLPKIPGDFPVPILIVQHMPALFTEMLASRLAQQSILPVLEGKSGLRVEPGHIYIAPGDYHMIVERRGASILLRTTQDSPENFCRPSADVLFRSAAELYGDGTLALVMTGMGQDGLRGCMRIREAGGRILAQDEASSVVWGMPGYVAKAGLAEAVLPLDRLAAEIRRRIPSGNPHDETPASGRTAVSLAAMRPTWR